MLNKIFIDKILLTCDDNLNFLVNCIKHPKQVPDDLINLELPNEVDPIDDVVVITKVVADEDIIEETEKAINKHHKVHLMKIPHIDVL